VTLAYHDVRQHTESGGHAGPSIKSTLRPCRVGGNRSVILTGRVGIAQPGHPGQGGQSLAPIGRQVLRSRGAGGLTPTSLWHKPVGRSIPQSHDSDRVQRNYKEATIMTMLQRSTWAKGFSTSNWVRRTQVATTTKLRQLTWALVATGAMTLTACSEQVAEPNGSHTVGDALSAKGGGGNGGGGKPGSGTTADPAIAFSAPTSCRDGGGGLWVINADGSNRSDLRDCDSPLGPNGWLAAWSPNGKSIAYYDVALNELRVIDVALDAQGHPIGQNLRLLVSTGDAATPAWSPLGDVIAYSFAGSIYTVPASGGAPMAVCSACGNDPTWSPDGSTVAFRSPNSSAAALRTVALGTGVIQTLIPEGNFERIDQPDWSRSGDRIAFDGTPLGGGPRGTYVLDVATGAYSLLTDLGYPASWSPDDEELVVKNHGGGYGGAGGLVVNSTSGALIRPIGKRTSMSWPDWRRCSPGPGCGPGN